MVLSELLMSLALGLFKCVNKSEQAYYINAHSAHITGLNHLIYLYATGRLVSRGLLDGATLSAFFCVSLLKLILGVSLSLSDLAYYVAEM